MIQKKDDGSLQALLDALGKHTGYQQLPRMLEPLLRLAPGRVQSRHEEARMAYIAGHIEFTGKRVLDIGANSGYFSFEALEAGAAAITVYEGWTPHARFVKAASEALGIHDRVDVHNQYFDFQHPEGAWDICFLLNVLHHLGDDFGSSALSMMQARDEMLAAINRMSHHAKTLVLQLGFCWKGNAGLGLFENGTKSELLEFLDQGTAADWRIEQVGIAKRIMGEVVYQPRNESNMLRDDSLGEFLNRPLIIMTSRHL